MRNTRWMEDVKIKLSISFSAAFFFFVASQSSLFVRNTNASFMFLCSLANNNVCGERDSIMGNFELIATPVEKCVYVFGLFFFLVHFPYRSLSFCLRSPGQLRWFFLNIFLVAKPRVFSLDCIKAFRTATSAFSYWNSNGRTSEAFPDFQPHFYLFTNFCSHVGWPIKRPPKKH